MQGNNSSGAFGGTTDDPLVGRTVGDHYIIEALLGSGAKGKVFRASHRKLHHKLLLKLMPVSWLGDGEARGQFEQDAKSLAGMEHDNITAVHDFGLEDRGVFLAEELVEGELLSEYVERRGALPLAEFVPIGAQILKGMGAAHARGLLHCDLKPGNIILCEHQGRANFVKICDLGLLQMIGGGGVDSKISAGTPGYMAPEQITDQQIDARADVYTIGVLFYLMLSGRLPYAGDSATNLLYKQVNERPTPLGEALASGHDVPDGIISLVHSCLARNPEERPIDANEIVEHLIDSVPAALFRLPKAGSIPTVAGAIEPTPPPRPISAVSVPETRPREHSHPAIVPVPPAAPAPVTVSVDGAYNESTPVDDADEEEESKSSGGVFIALLAVVAVGVGVYFYMQGLTPGVGGPQAPIAKAPTGQQVGTPVDAKAAPADQWLQAASGHEARREYEEAALMYRKVLAEQSDNLVAMTGLKRVEASLAASDIPTDSSVNNGAGSDGSGADASTDGETTEGSETTDGDEASSEGDSATTTTTGAAAVEPVVKLVSVEVQASSEDEKTKVNVYVDKKKVGTAPIVLDLKPGKHTLELKSRGHRNIRRNLNVVAGKKIKPINVKLKKRPDPINHNIEIDPEDGPATVIQM